MTRIHNFAFAALLVGGLAMATTACKSQLDDKPAAKTESVDKAAADKAATDKPADKPADKAAAEKPADKAAAEKPAEGKSLKVDAATSTIGFVGAKITGDHEGKFSKFTGEATVAGGKATAVSFEVEMAEFTTDSEKLTGHLKSPDFFDVAKFPKASFKSTEIKEGGEGDATHTIVGELTLRSVTKKITFPATVAVTDAGATGKSQFKINRKDFGIEYPGKKDDLIKDDVLLKLDLKFKAAGG